jgi:Ca2+-binding RTX toxin-like protein
MAAYRDTFSPIDATYSWDGEMAFRSWSEKLFSLDDPTMREWSQSVASASVGFDASVSAAEDKPAQVTVSDVDYAQATLPREMTEANELSAANGRNPVYAQVGTYEFQPEWYAPLIIQHDESMQLENGTISFTFTVDRFIHNAGLFSKDVVGFGGGGHISVFQHDDRDLMMRYQDASGNSHFIVAHGAMQDGQTYDFAFTFGDRGLEMWLDGVRVAHRTDLTFGLENNTEHMVFGAGGWSSQPGQTNSIGNHMDGSISDIRFFDSQMTAEAIWGEEVRDNHEYFARAVRAYRFDTDNGGNVVVSRGKSEITLDSDTDYMDFRGFSARVYDVQILDDGANQVWGQDGGDIIFGMGGDDTLQGQGNDDYLRGGDGNDLVSGGVGRDWLFGERGNDRLWGGEHNDKLWGGGGNDEIKGDSGNDRFWGGLGDDIIYGHSWGWAGNDGNDRAIYKGDYSDYSIVTTTFWNGQRNDMMQGVIITDRGDGGSDGKYEGRDTLYDIDFIVFNDTTIAVADLF